MCIRDRTNLDLKYAAWNGTSWDLATVDSAGNVGFFTSLALDAAGMPRISYFDDTDDDLRYAAWDGASWDVEIVDSAWQVGWYTSLALDACDNPRISYLDITNDDLKYAAAGECAAQLTIVKAVTGDGAPSDWSFGFTGDVDVFSLTDEDPYVTYSNVTPGVVAVNETNPPGYATAALCTNGDSATDGNLSVTLNPGIPVSCTFTNTICQPGYFDTAATWACAPAGPGYFVATVGAAAQVACAPGTYQPSSGAVSCLQADAGYYATGPAATAQTACPEGTTSPAGSDSIEDCVLIPPPVSLLYIAPNRNNGMVDGVAYMDEDIIVNTLGTADWAMYFDGSDVGITKNLTDFTFTADDCLLMTFNGCLLYTSRCV